MYKIWIRHGKVGGTSLQFALSNEIAGNRWKGAGLISLTPVEGKVIEVQSQNISYAYGIDTFKAAFPGVWEESYKFTLVRNPYDRIISAWKFFEETARRPFSSLIQDPFEGWGDAINYHLTRPQTADLIVNGSLDVDLVLRFETLPESYATLCKTLDIPEKYLPHLRASAHKPFQAYYNPHLAGIVYEMFKDDFKYLNYDKDSWLA